MGMIYRLIKRFVEGSSLRGEYILTYDTFQSILIRGLVCLVVIIIIVLIIKKVKIKLNTFNLFSNIPLSVWLLTLTGALVRFLYLNVQMRTDESFSFINFTAKPFIIAVMKYNSTNNHLLNTLLSNISYSLFGMEEWAIRLPVFIFGILTIPLTYKLTQRFNSNSLLPTIFVTFSGLLIHYSTSARGYSILTFLFVALLVINNRDSLFSAILGALCIYCNAIGVYAVIFAYMVTRPKLPTIIYTILITALLYLPVYMVNGTIFPNKLYDFTNSYNIGGLMTFWLSEFPIAKYLIIPMFYLGLLSKFKALIPSIIITSILLLPMRAGFPPQRAFTFFVPIFFVVALGYVWER